MKAVVLREIGGEFQIEDVPDPSGEAIVTVRAAGINFLDVLIRRGLYPQMPELPYVPGIEVAGELDGRRVAALAHVGGGYAERAAVDPQLVFELPEGASFASGASFLMTYLTAYIPLQHRARVAPGSSVLVHAASGGVGSAAVQIAKSQGAYVVGTASTAEKREVVRANGADEVRGYDEIDDLRVDVVLDPVGGDVFTRSLPLLRPRGVIVAIGYVLGVWSDPSVQWLVGRNAGVLGFYLGRLIRHDPEFVRDCAAELLALWSDGKIDPVVGARYALVEAAAAHALIENRQHTGKVVLEP